MSRPQCSVYIATSVDGFIARPDGGLDWLDRVQVEGEDYGYAEFFGSIDAIVFGRSTWEVARGFEPWPYAGRRCIVLTHRELDASHGEERHHGDLEPLLERLHGEGVRRVYVDGGQVIRHFLAGGLVDDLTLSIVPVLLGEGIPLFASGGPGLDLRLLESRAFPSGLVQLRYARASSTGNLVPSARPSDHGANAG